MSEGKDTQPELPLPSQRPQESQEDGEMISLLEEIAMTVVAATDRIRDLETKQEEGVQSLTDRIGEHGTKTKAVEGAVQALHRHIQSDEHRKLVSADIDRQVGTLKTEVEYLRGKFLGHIDRMEKTNHQAYLILEDTKKIQRIATGAFEKSKREVVVSRRWVYWVYAAFLIVVAWGSASAAFIFSDFIDGDWAHQLNTANDPSAFCQQQGFVVDMQQNGGIICASDVRVIREFK